MSKKSIIYKIYSVCLLLLSGFSVIASLIFLIRSFNALSLLSLICSLISFFFIYVEFSSIYSFSDMLEYDRKGISGTFKRKSFVFSPKFYKSYGFVIFVICCILMSISSIAGIVVSLVLKTNIIFTLISILIFAFCVLLMYITYNLRYKAFSGLFSLFETGDDSELRNQKPHYLRMYGAFSIVMFVISTVFLLVLSVVSITAVTTVFGLWKILFGLICFLVLVICCVPLLVNCMLYIDMADMTEKYMTRNSIGRKEIKAEKELNSAKSILSYEYAGGIYSVIIWLNAILLFVCCAAEIFIFSLTVTNMLSGGLVALLSTAYSGYSLLLTIISLLFIVCISLVLYHCFLNRNTGFEIYENGIIGTAVVNEGFAHKVEFELNKDDINSVSVQGMFFVILSDGLEYRIMITSRDFKRRLISVING